MRTLARRRRRRARWRRRENRLRACFLVLLLLFLAVICSQDSLSSESEEGKRRRRKTRRQRTHRERGTLSVDVDGDATHARCPAVPGLSGRRCSDTTDLRTQDHYNTASSVPLDLHLALSICLFCLARSVCLSIYLLPWVERLWFCAEIDHAHVGAVGFCRFLFGSLRDVDLLVCPGCSVCTEISPSPKEVLGLSLAFLLQATSRKA